MLGSQAVMRIHDIFVSIRIHGSMPLTNGSRSGADPDPSIFIVDLQDANKKLILKKSFSAYYFLKALLHHLSMKKVKKNCGSTVFAFSRNLNFTL